MAGSILSLGKALAVLQVVASNDRPPTVAEIASQVGVPRPTAYRLVASLISEGYLAEVDSRYIIGLEILPLAAAILDNNPLRMAALPHLQSLSERVGERTNLGVLYRGKVMSIGGIERPSLPTLYSRFGRTIPPYRTALGKVLLSERSDEEVRQIMGSGPFERTTPNTITTIEELLNELAKVRKRGYSTEIGENQETSRCIGALITQGDEKAVGAISISMSSRTNTNDLNDFASELLRTAEIISHVVRGQGVRLETADLGSQRRGPATPAAD